LPIHIGQRFRYHRPIVVGEQLSCTVSTVPADQSRPFALIRLEVSDDSGAAVCQAESEIVIAQPGFSWDRQR
jgi:hypothetical protein